MNTASIRWSSVIPGIVLLLLGAIWALQGLGLIGGSFMSRQLLWTGIGSIVALVGIFLVYRGVSQRT